ncbi:hypothetical protein, partial [Pseudolysinimonas sp.]|uniref:hypothetical protein n=1 Tax=Pseudolysinimonas sp. TaxID=2680009 RepID=UPI003785043E
RAALRRTDRRTAVVGAVLRHAPALYAAHFAIGLAVRRSAIVRALARAVRRGISAPERFQERRIDADGFAS